MLFKRMLDALLFPRCSGSGVQCRGSPDAAAELTRTCPSDLLLSTQPTWRQACLTPKQLFTLLRKVCTMEPHRWLRFGSFSSSDLRQSEDRTIRASVFWTTNLLCKRCHGNIWQPHRHNITSPLIFRIRPKHRLAQRISTSPTFPSP